MKKIYFLLLLFCCASGSASAQQWVWSKVVPRYNGFFMSGMHSLESGEHLFLYRTPYNMPQQSKILRMDASGNITDSLLVNLKIEKFNLDNSGNFIISGRYIDSFNYANVTIHSRGYDDNYLLKISSTGSLIFLKSIGYAQSDHDMPGLVSDSAGRTYISYDLDETLYINNDSIIQDPAFSQTAIVIFNTDGTLNSSIIKSTPHPSYGYYYADRLFFGNHGEFYSGIGSCAPNECYETIIQYSNLHDSVNSFPGGVAGSGAFFDETRENIYYYTNPASHYYWEPVLHKFRLSDRTALWQKNLGSAYSPFCLSAILLPGDVILTYGRGGGDYGGAGNATLDDTTLTFGEETEMLMALMDTSGHFYSVINEKVQRTAFINASYDHTGHAYLLSQWSKDTTYTMGTTFTTVGGYYDYVISKLKYKEIVAGIDGNININKTSNINIFPNPSNGKFNVEMANNIQSLSICIYDLLGNCISTQKTNNTTSQIIDMSNQAKGIYFVEINTGQQTINKKIILN